MITKSKYAHGKLLLTGEYLVMQGARALALPLNVGQYLSWKKTREKELIWNAMKPDGIWFQAKFSLPGLTLQNTTDKHLAGKLIEILKKTRSLNPGFLHDATGYEVQTILEFDPEFGFGSSSTLISNIAGWAEVNAYELAAITFGGSGYDIACARAKNPLFYNIYEGKPRVEPAKFSPDFKENLLFVYLGKKQLTGESVASFKKNSQFTPQQLARISRIGREIDLTVELPNFEALINEHEDIMSSILNAPKVKDLYFSDHRGAVKSLGAWGGDFVLMTFHEEYEKVTAYLESLKFDVYYTYSELVG